MSLFAQACQGYHAFAYPTAWHITPLSLATILPVKMLKIQYRISVASVIIGSYNTSALSIRPSKALTSPHLYHKRHMRQHTLMAQSFVMPLFAVKSHCLLQLPIGFFCRWVQKACLHTLSGILWRYVSERDQHQNAMHFMACYTSSPLSLNCIIFFEL